MRWFPLLCILALIGCGEKKQADPPPPTKASTPVHFDKPEVPVSQPVAEAPLPVVEEPAPSLPMPVAPPPPNDPHAKFRAIMDSLRGNMSASYIKREYGEPFAKHRDGKYIVVSYLDLADLKPAWPHSVTSFWLNQQGYMAFYLIKKRKP